MLRTLSRSMQAGGVTALAVLFLAALPWSSSPRPAGGSPERVFAAIDFAPAPGEIGRNRERLARLIEEAHRQGARYVVVPELPLTGGSSAAAGKLPALAEPIPGPTTDYFGALARRLGIWLAFSMPEMDADQAGYFVTSVLVDDQGEIVDRHRKNLLDEEDGTATRGSFRDILRTVDDQGLRLGVLSGHDIMVGIPRHSNLGADVILITAGWSAADAMDWSELTSRLSKEYSVHVVVANRLPADAGELRRPGGIYALGSEIRPPPEADGSGPLVRALPPRRPAWLIESSLGLPLSVPVPSHEPATPEIAELGRQLFFDANLSSSGQVSCASCHRPEKAFTNGEAMGTGVYGRKTYRNVPSLLNVAFRPLLRWDGYASTLENFAKYPVSGYNEMDFHYLDKVGNYVRSRPDYVTAFRSSMGVDEIQFDHVARALATYQRTLISGSSPFDRYYYGGDRSALSAGARRGLALFQGKAGCMGCHLIGRRSALFMDFAYHSLGVGYAPEPGISSDIGLGAISTNDLTGFFQTPSLRNVADTGPYMHDGSMATLRQVIDFYDRGGTPEGTRQAGLKALFLTEQEKQDLEAFLRSLTGDQRYDAQGRRLAPLHEAAPAR